MTQEDRFRMAETLIQEAKKLLWPEWNDYADVQQIMFDLESVRMKMDILVSKQIEGKLQ